MSLTNAEKFKLCLARANRIVRAYRKMAPHGCDPQASWVAIGVTVASAAISYGTSAYEKSQAQDNSAAIFGTKPKVAPFVPTDLSTEQGKAVGEDTQNYGSITDLLNKIIPNFSDSLTTGTSNALQEMHGQLPQDVQDEVMRSDAFKSLSGGYSGSGMENALTARDLGLTSLQLQQTGQNSAQSWATIAQSAYAPFTISTAEQAATTAANNAGEQATAQYKNNVAAAPDPAAAGLFNLSVAQTQQLNSTLSSGLAAYARGSYGTAGAGASGTGGFTPATGAPNYNYDPSIGYYGGVSSPSGIYSGPTGFSNDSFNSSDVRLKDRIVYLRTTPRGYRVYRFHYKGGETEFEGVLAHEVQAVLPEAVREEDGYWKVNYDLLDTKMKTYKEAA